MKGYILEYINENEFKKLERALKKYNMLAYKKLNFEYYPALRSGNFIGELISTNKKDSKASDHKFFIIKSPFFQQPETLFLYYRF